MSVEADKEQLDELEEFFSKNRILLDIVDGKVVVTVGKYTIRQEDLAKNQEELEQQIAKMEKGEGMLSEEKARELIEGTEEAKQREATAEQTQDNKFKKDFEKLFKKYVSEADEEDQEKLKQAWEEYMEQPFDTSSAAPVKEQTRPGVVGSGKKKTGLFEQMTSVAGRLFQTDLRASSPMYPTSTLFQSDLSAVQIPPDEQ